jgi:hypothetical protein
MRGVVTDVRGLNKFHEYQLSFYYACWDDQLTITLANNLGSQSYVFG